MVLKYWKYIFFAVLFVSLFAAIKSCKENKAEKQRFESNYNNVVNNNSAVEVLHSDEVATYYYLIDSLRKQLNIREKTVNTIWVTKYNYKDSTLLDIRIKDSINYILVYLPKEININKPCYDLNLKFEKDTINTIIAYHDQLTGFLHWERPHKFLFIRWGTKEYFLKLYSGCKKDTIKVDKLILIE